MIVTQWGRHHDSENSGIEVQAIMNKYECRAVMELEGKHFGQKVLLELRATAQKERLRHDGSYPSMESLTGDIWDREDPHYYGSLKFPNISEERVVVYLKEAVRNAQIDEAELMTVAELKSKRVGYFASRSIVPNSGSLFVGLFEPVNKEAKMKELLKFMKRLHKQREKIQKEGGYIMPAYLTDTGNPEFVPHVWED